MTTAQSKFAFTDEDFENHRKSQYRMQNSRVLPDGMNLSKALLDELTDQEAAFAYSLLEQDEN